MVVLSVVEQRPDAVGAVLDGADVVEVAALRWTGWRVLKQQTIRVAGVPAFRYPEGVGAR